jgi:hypothetical protein
VDDRFETVLHLRGSEDPPAGWVSRRYDVKQQADAVYCQTRVTGSTVLRSRIRWQIGSGSLS